MFIFLLLAMIWWGGRGFGVPSNLRFLLISIVWIALIGVHLLFPAENGLRIAIGGSATTWAALGVLGLVVIGYRQVLVTLRLRVQPVEAVPASGGFRAAELDRYARHILLREIGGMGQRRLKDARVLVIGAGGLGSSALLYLAASGVGHIGVIDDDVVEGSNLQRQIIHTDARIGMAKVHSAAIAIKSLNPFIEVLPYHRRLTEDIAQKLIGDYDLVLDGTDNFDTRYLVNRVCADLAKPLVSAAITQWEGQISLYDPATGGPCYACVFPTPPAPGTVPTCAAAGVASPLPGVMGSMMAMEAVKHLTQAGKGLQGRLFIHDALNGETRVVAMSKRIDCLVCGRLH